MGQSLQPFLIPGLLISRIHEHDQSRGTRDSEALHQRLTEFDEDLVEGPLDRDLREPEHLPAQRGRLLRVMPANDLAELVVLQVGDAEPIAQLVGIEPAGEVLLEPRDAVVAEAVVAIEVVADESVDPPADAGPHPAFEHGPNSSGQVALFEGAGRAGHGTM